MRQLDIAICGCGPAGMSVALLLQRKGHRVRVFDRFATPKPVGSGLLLQPTGLGVLAELGLLTQISLLGTPVRRLFGLAMPAERIALDVRYEFIGTGWSALGIHRAALFEVLYRAVLDAGIEVHAATAIGLATCGARARLLTVEDKRVGEFDLIIDALGANSPLARHNARRRVLPYGALWLNIPWPGANFHADRLDQRYNQAKQMLGLLPIGKQSLTTGNQAALFWSLKRSDLDAWRSRGIQHWRDEIARLWPQAADLISQTADPEEVTFAQYDHFTASIPFCDLVVQIGDAAHATSPQLGQGANMALLDAIALAHALSECKDLSDALRRYASMRRWHVRLFQYASALFTPFYQSDSWLLPIMRDWLAAPASRLPVGREIVARLVSGMTVAPMSGRNFQTVRLGMGHLDD